MSEIKADSKKSFSVEALLQRLKNYIFPGKLSFRLAGLVATAVIVFFIIHISFIRQGKFDLPQETKIQDSILIPEQETKSIAIKEEETPQAPGLAKEPVPQASQKATSFQDKGGGELSIRLNEPQPIIEVADRNIEKLHETPKLFEQQPNVVAEEVAEKRTIKKSIPDGSAASQKEAKQVIAKPAYMSLEKREVAEKDASQVQSVDASNARTLPDTSIFKFRLTHQKALAVSEMTEKIKIWEDFIQTQPELDLLRKAKYEQARLYFDLAHIKMNEYQVTQAIQFYEKNFEYLAAIADTSQIERELDTLRQLFEKR